VRNQYIAKPKEKMCGDMASRAYARGVRLNPLLELDILQNFITCAKEINCFRIRFDC